MEYFASLERRLGKLAENVGFTTIYPGLYSKEIGQGSIAWISLTGNDYFISPIIGVVYERVIREMYSIRESFDSNSLKHKMPINAGPPLPVGALRDLVVANMAHPKSVDWEQTGGHLSDSQIDQLVSDVKWFGCEFIDRNRSIEKGIKTALEIAKFGESQRYLIPTAMAICGYEKEYIRDYTSEILSLQLTAESREYYISYMTELFKRLELR